MTFTSAVRSSLYFRTRQVTALGLLLYVAVFVTILVGDRLAPVPGPEAQAARGLNLDEAYQDLHAITARPHPYNSRENDRVRAHLLNRLKSIAWGNPSVHVLDDSTTAAFLDGSAAKYFQGNNILVKIDGSEIRTNGSAILFSAHFDSVPTAPGATDDGMNIASLIQMVAYLSKNRPRRTAIFNFNNGEEDGLHGAHSFLAHPWANLTTTFVNFEGAGAGGRPFLFRANSLPVLRAFTHRHIPHPYANSISADAFAMRVIRSETDYAVYAGRRPNTSPSNGGVQASDHSGYTSTGGGMRGADVAFMRHRARYHTPEDSIRAMGREGSRRALWATMETVRGAGAALLDMSINDLAEDVDEGAEPSTYFELFGTYLVVFPLRVLLAAFIVLLVAGPLLLFALAFLLQRQAPANGGRRASNLKGYGRFWLALLIAIALHAGLVVGYLKLNSYAVHAHSTSVVSSILSLSYLGFVLPLGAVQLIRPIPPAKQKLAILVELYVLTWILLIGATILTGAKNISGLHWVGAWNAAALLAVVSAIIEELIEQRHGGHKVISPSVPEDGGTRQEEAEEPEAATERTPLIARRSDPAGVTSSAAVLSEKNSDRSPFWWIVQMLFSIPTPVYQIGTLMQLWTQSMAQTGPDGGWAGVTYIPLSIVSTLIFLPLAPYAHKMHVSLTAVIFVTFVVSTAQAWLTWPFDTSGARLKVWFSSHVELENLTTTTHNMFPYAQPSVPQFAYAETALAGVPSFIDLVVDELPSSWAGNASAISDGNTRRSGLTTRAWTVTPRWYPAVDAEGRWIEANAVRVNETAAYFTIRGEGTRACRISVSNRSIRRFRARSHRERKWTEYTIPEASESGIKDLRLWTRTWEDTFEVEVGFKEQVPGRVEGRVSCGWAEYTGSWVAGIGAQSEIEYSVGARIPALEEVLAFMPEWAVVTKFEDALVSASSGFILE